MNFLCDRGHEITAPVVLPRCPLVVRGCPCPGTLTEVGPNWGVLKKTKAETVAHYEGVLAEARGEG